MSSQRGEVIVRLGTRGTGYQLRFYAYGQRCHRTLNSRDGWTEESANQELQNVLADVRRGIWQPDSPATAPVEVEDEVPTFHMFSSTWLDARKDELAPNTVLDYTWQLTDHLLPFFADHRLTDITVPEVDRYRNFKVREGALSAVSINKTLTRLGQILELALEYDLVDKNAARVGGRRRRVKEKRPAQVYLDRADQIVALLGAARELEAEARRNFKSGRPAFLAVLIFAGLRISEALALRVRDVDLANGRLRVTNAKTDSGVRYVELLPVLRDELAAHKATLRDVSPGAFMFPTSTGGRQNRHNARNRIFDRAVERANKRLIEAALTPLPEGLTPHCLRRTCISLRVAMGEDIAYVAEQVGHADTSITHKVYVRVMRLDDKSREALKRLVAGEEWVQMGANLAPVPIDAPVAAKTAAPKLQ